jgi:uncharacterized protein DUF29
MTRATYDTDFYAWTQAQAAALRAHTWDALDIDHLVEELEDVGNEQRHAIASHARNLLLHLLKWVYQPTRRRRSWRSNIRNARIELDWRLTRNPSLRRELGDVVAWAYPRARRLAVDETGLPLATFPETCPWGVDQLLDEDFWPEDGAR